MKWITRSNANVDRVACPWLIRRFIDPAAEFLFVPTDQVATVAAREGATPYDIVHGADIPSEITIEPEAAGLRAVAYGFALVHGANNHEKIRLETPMYDALYRWCQGRVARGG